MKALSLFGERSSTIVAATFQNGHAADRMADVLEREPGMAAVSVVGPNDPQAGAKLQPEPAGIARTMVRSHLILGAAGLVGGVFAALLSMASGWPPATTSPWLMTLFLAATGLFVGLMLAGLVALRPDHSWLIGEVREACSRRQWTVVAHPTSRHQAHRAWQLLKRSGARTLRTL